VKHEIIVGFVNKKYDFATAVLYFSVFSFCFFIGGFVAAVTPQATEWRNHQLQHWTCSGKRTSYAAFKSM